MFRFLLVLILMVLSFMMGKISAQENSDFTVVYELPALETQATDQDLLTLILDRSFKMREPELYQELMIFLAVPTVQNALLSGDRANSAVYQTLMQKIAQIKMRAII